MSEKASTGISAPSLGGQFGGATDAGMGPGGFGNSLKSPTLGLGTGGQMNMGQPTIQQGSPLMGIGGLTPGTLHSMFPQFMQMMGMQQQPKNSQQTNPLLMGGFGNLFGPQLGTQMSQMLQNYSQGNQPNSILNMLSMFGMGPQSPLSIWPTSYSPF